MNVIDGQAGLIICASLIFYSLTIDNILNIIVLIIIAAITISTISGNSVISKTKNAKEQVEIESELNAIRSAVNQTKNMNKYGEIEDAEFENQLKTASNSKAEVLEKNFDKEKIIVFNDVREAYLFIEGLVGKEEVYALFENDLPDTYNEK